MPFQLDSWRNPPERLAAKSEEVHVWRAGLDRPRSIVESLLEILDSDERRQAERFHFEKDRTHFVVAHAVLRKIISRYVGVPPEALSFRSGPQGKPALTEDWNGNGLRFNMSHSHGLALYGVTRGREVGIDLEYIRRDFASLEIARSFFSQREIAMLSALPWNELAEGFFNCWTRKEAYIKAIGEGLSHPLNQFDVSLAPGEPAALLSTVENPPAASRWTLKDVAPCEGYAAAVAVEGHGWSLNCWQFPD
ncbi:MAG: 4'-phosphopantetheinyl transferase superfamily protein [Pyrinomonadaceae bacterium]|nr:4'-phosphopantetheinyl transferase superfamily protein [Pyrinomonadaceae bacterium]